MQFLKHIWSYSLRYIQREVEQQKANSFQKFQSMKNGFVAQSEQSMGLQNIKWQ